MFNKIIIRGAKEHNLKDLDLELPRNKMIVFTGLSGSGKSSLAFDTIFAEGQRRYTESLSAYARQFLGRMQKPDVTEIEGLSPAISIDQKHRSANPRSTVATITEIYDYLRVLYARIGEPYCPECGTKIEKMTVEEIVNIIIERSRISYQGKKFKDKKTSILATIVSGRKGEYYQMLYDLYSDGFSEVRIDGKLKKLSEQIILDKNKKHTIELVTDSFDADSVFHLKDKDARQRLSESVETALDYGDGAITVKFVNGKEKLFSARFSCPKCNFSFPEIEPRLFSFNSPYGACPACYGLGTKTLFSKEVCPSCQGKRLCAEALSVLIAGKNITEIVEMDIEKAIDFFLKIKLTKTQKEISDAALKEILNRLQFMMDVGLEYLTLSRRAGTLSGGEAQRIRLASQVGLRLVGALYVLDEPTIGLHQRDNQKLIETLKNLRDIGNTIIIVEHDEDTIRAADYLVDFGPGAGKHGGEIVCAGNISKIFDNKRSLTCAYLRGEKKILLPEKRKVNNKDCLEIVSAYENNLKNVNIKIPLRRFVCVTGVSGSGKSSFAYDVVYTHLANRLNGADLKKGKFKEIKGLEYLSRAVLVNQAPIGRTPRSNPATYTGVFTEIRELFAATTEARFRNYKPKRFSFNVPGGRCEHCKGHGQLAIEMHFLPTVFVECDICKGKRFDRETLEVHYKKKNIAEILAMTVETAHKFFKDIPQIADKLRVLEEVGLGYLELGQSATTLSGGEAQRIKLSNELGKRMVTRTFYLLDEPTTGLHFEDIKQLLKVLHRLVEKGNSVIVIEHNLDVIKTADYIIDLGPEGGNKGGRVVAKGTPEEVARNEKSWTGKYLREKLR